MAHNGILEAFFASVCTPADLQTQSRMMAAASVSLVATSLAGSRLFGMGDTALVWANTTSMAVRALYNARIFPDTGSSLADCRHGNDNNADLKLLMELIEDDADEEGDDAGIEFELTQD
jgi:hypothetical protein